MDFVKSIILKSSVDKGRVFGALLTDVSKMFECLYHELLIAKLNENGFSLRTFIIVHDQFIYLIGNKEQELETGVEVGLTLLRLLLFNIFLCRLICHLKGREYCQFCR